MASYDQQIYDAAIGEGFSSSAAKLIVAQARLESKDYGSNVFNNNFNMFGMKYVGQPLASRGTAAPSSEQTCNLNCNSDYYAKYANPSDSAKDLVGRLYKKTRNGIGFNELKDVSDPYDFANKLKARNYYGTNVTAQQYGNSLKAKLLKVQVLEWVRNNPKSTIFAALVALGLGIYLAVVIKRNIK